MPEQIEAITGRRLRKPYRSMITAQAAHLPEVYAARERREFQQESAGLRARELTLMEESQETQERQAKRANMLAMMGTGAMIGGSVGGPPGAAIGAGAGLIVGFVSSFF